LYRGPLRNLVEGETRPDVDADPTSPHNNARGRRWNGRRHGHLQHG